MCSNTGTYIDSPFHRYEDGKDLSQLALEYLASLEGIRVEVDEGVRTIDVDTFYDLDVYGKAVLIQTDWSKNWNTEEYFEGHPFLTEQAALYFKNNGAKLVGIDSFNIDGVSGEERPVHSTLLEAEIFIVEHMCNLDSVPVSDFTFYAVPVKVKGFGTFPVLAFVEIET
jgi:kynurenine formamidase